MRDPLRLNRLPVTSVRSEDAPPVTGFVSRLIGDVEGLLELPTTTFRTVAEMHSEVSGDAPEQSRGS